jgi:hypothetical protein
MAVESVNWGPYSKKGRINALLRQYKVSKAGVKPAMFIPTAFNALATCLAFCARRVALVENFIPEGVNGSPR